MICQVLQDFASFSQETGRFNQTVLVYGGRGVGHNLIAPTQVEAGCINYDLHRSIENPALFLFYENWVNRKH